MGEDPFAPPGGAEVMATLKRGTLIVTRVSISSGFRQMVPPEAGDSLVQAASNRSTTIRSARSRACHRS